MDRGRLHEIKTGLHKNNENGHFHMVTLVIG